jgi:hypothetical protein
MATRGIGFVRHAGYAYEMNKAKAKAPGLNLAYIFTLIVGLLIAHWVTVRLTLHDPIAASASWSAWFDLDREYNVPTATNALLLGLCSLTALGLATKSYQTIQRVGWLLFSIFFGYLALDELLIIHEQLGEPLRRFLGISGFNPLYHAWVVPALAVIVGMLFATWVIRRYHRQLRIFSEILLLLAVLASGVVACEIIGTFVYPHTEAYRLFMVPLEEIFELSMAAVILNNLVSRLKGHSVGGTKKTA